jgi:lysozyme
MRAKVKKKIVIYAILLIILTSITMAGNAAENLIKYFEAGDGLEKYLNAYLDPVGIWTIGYGSIFNYDQNRKVLPGDKIDQTTALRYLRYETQNIIPKIQNLVKVPINQNQLDSLTSFVYNVGLGNFGSSTLLKLLNSGATKEIVAEQFLRWNKGTVNGKTVILHGLTIRREAEKKLFLK